MFALLNKPGRLCDTLARRELLRVGGLSLFGLHLPRLLAGQSRANDTVTAGGSGFGCADSVLLVYLQGSPSHIDLWDPKPDAPLGIRGEFQPIACSTPGMFLGEVLPQLAAQSEHYTIVRSIGVDPKGLRNHGAAIYMLMTGHDPSNFTPTGLATPPSREDLPSVGAVIARHRPAARGQFSNVAVGAPVKEGRVIGVGQSAGLLGAAFDPVTVYDDATQPLQLQGFTLPDNVPLDRLRSRVDLRGIIESQAEIARRLQSRSVSHVAAGGSGSAFDEFYDSALALVESDAAVRAFRLEDETPTLRDRYGMTRFGQSCLLARRLIEAGTRFVQVTWPARSDDEPAPGTDGSWDTHRNNFPMLRDHRCPVFDRSMSALIEDMAARGLLERTLVVAIGEFGRSPKIGAPTTDNVGPGGRDHWPECYSFLIAGGGVRPGSIYGASDRDGAWPKQDAVHPYDLIATVYHALGIDHRTEYLDTLKRPRRLVQAGAPIAGLF
ncbi:MAG: DUF1501 domain-containing protein [Planctomycetaceae bacterium]|nr:DUF1501 domain-containing protein [Planctomycetaceae bacterium]